MSIRCASGCAASSCWRCIAPAGRPRRSRPTGRGATHCVEELGLEPGPALKELEAAILRQDPGLELAPPVRRARTPASPPRARRSCWSPAARSCCCRDRRRGAWRSAGGRERRPSSPVAPNSVAVIDPATDRIVADIPVGVTPSSIAAGEGGVWVLNADDRTLSKIDPGSLRVEQDRRRRARADGPRRRRGRGLGRQRRRGGRLGGPRDARPGRAGSAGPRLGRRRGARCRSRATLRARRTRPALARASTRSRWAATTCGRSTRRGASRASTPRRTAWPARHEACRRGRWRPIATGCGSAPPTTRCCGCRAGRPSRPARRARHVLARGHRGGRGRRVGDRPDRGHAVADRPGAIGGDADDPGRRRRVRGRVRRGFGLGGEHRSTAPSCASTRRATAWSPASRSAARRARSRSATVGCG